MKRPTNDELGLKQLNNNKFNKKQDFNYKNTLLQLSDTMAIANKRRRHCTSFYILTGVEVVNIFGRAQHIDGFAFGN